MKFNFAGTGSKQVRLYGDWNQDGDFIDVGEELFNSANSATTISIPSTLKQDNFYRIRWVAENGSGSAPSCFHRTGNLRHMC
ncbi:MAG: GEVED domain-containing protein [Cytophagales bacterium]|nr:GEVED domain-containing protein [Cytophagales bacterium]